MQTVPGESESAFSALYKDLLRFAGSIAPVGLDGGDVLHEALVHTLRRHPDFRGIENVRAYLMRACLNVANSRRRRDKTLGRILPRLVANDQQDSTASLVVATSMLAGIPPRQRACVFLRDVVNAPVAEVASVLGCSEGTVKSQTSKGRRALREMLRRMDCG